MCRLIVGRLLGKSSAHHVPAQEPQPQTQQHSRQFEAFLQLKEEFGNLAVEKDRAKAGLALEKLLNRLFELFDLKPRQPFRVAGEQIDGSFELDGQIYLLELKWEQNPLPEADLLVFRGKIEGKSTFTRGVFIALNGISDQARDAITRGKAPSFFVMDGYDLMMVLSEAVNLTHFLRQRVRLLAEEGRVCVPFSELV
jgi:Restriction endonuclease